MCKLQIATLLILTSVLGACSKVVTMNGQALSDPVAQAPVGSVSLNWDSPSANTDDTALSDLASYRIRYGSASGNYANTVDVGLSTNYTIQNLTSGTTYYFAVAALNTSGVESDLSNEVAKKAQ